MFLYDGILCLKVILGSLGIDFADYSQGITDKTKGAILAPHRESFAHN